MMYFCTRNQALRVAQLRHTNRVSHRDNHGGKRMCKCLQLKIIIFMNPNSDLKNNESVMAANAESSTIEASNAETSTVDAGYAESRISEYAARFAAYSDERLKQTMDHERKVRGWGSERSYFLAALRGECEKRGIDYCWK